MEITNTPENQLFNFSYEFLRQAHDIYRQYCFENDFINRCASWAWMKSLSTRPAAKMLTGRSSSA